MAIRIRNIGGSVVALCAAETDPLFGDIYLDDAAHHALSTKFGLDWKEMGFIENPPIDLALVPLMMSQKVRSAKISLEEWLEAQDKYQEDSQS
jgi:hypothetical protein